MRRSIILLALVLSLVIELCSLVVNPVTHVARAASILYPDLRTVPPSQLLVDRVTFSDGTVHNVLRFTNTIWNAGQGPMEVVGISSNSSLLAYQRIYNDSGGYTQYQVGEFVWHPEHQHYHFNDLAEYQLWRKADFDAWRAGSPRKPKWRGTKNSVCMVDSIHLHPELPGSPASAVYQNVCAQGIQGIAVGWGDTYYNTVYEQWIDLGASGLKNGDYVLRSVADPLNKLYESPGRNGSQDSDRDNEGLTFFKVKGGVITIQ